MDDLTHKNAIKNGDNTKCMRVTLVCKLVPIFFMLRSYDVYSRCCSRAIEGMDIVNE